MAKRICDYCGKEYITYTPDRGKHNFCSRQCSSLFKNKKVVLKCECCNKEIEKHLCEIKPNKHYFCSKKCFDNWQSRNKLIFTCKICGKKFKRSPSWLIDKKGYYCSLDCRNKDKEWTKKSYIKANLIQCCKKGLNKLELKGNEILDDLNLEYENQVLINKKICVDVLIKNTKIIIQWDGNYWHGKDLLYSEMDKRQRKRHRLDLSQDKYLLACGYTVLRFWESDVYNRKDFIYENIKKAIR